MENRPRHKSFHYISASENINFIINNDYGNENDNTILLLTLIVVTVMIMLIIL